MGDRRTCVNCKYENIDKRISHSDPRNPEPYEGYAIWCDKLEEFIGPNRAQGVKGECPYFIHY
jgi:hypothetical protein